MARYSTLGDYHLSDTGAAKDDIPSRRYADLLSRIGPPQ